MAKNNAVDEIPQALSGLIHFLADLVDGRAIATV